MSWIWLLPTGLACIAAGVAWVSVRALNAEAERLRDARRALPVLAQQDRPCAPRLPVPRRRARQPVMLLPGGRLT